MAASISQRIIDAVLAALTSAAPPSVTAKKGRKAPKNEPPVANVQVYWHHEAASGIGDPRKPMLMNRHMVLEIKVTVPGDDQDFDAQRQWIVAAMWSAGNFGGLAKNVSEAETIPYLEDSSESGTLTASAIRYAVEYTTAPGDLTAAH
jgi:hypothetical protein